MGTLGIVTDDHGSACLRVARVDAAPLRADSVPTLSPTQLPPAHAMTSPSDRYTVALQGFTSFERGALASFFRLAASGTPAYVQAERLDGCDFIVADADDPLALQAVRSSGRMADAVFIGAQTPGAMVSLARPVDPLELVRELNELVRLRLEAAARAEPPKSHRMPALGRLDVAGDGSRRDVLVVEDSAIARRFLQVRLQGLGYRVHLAASADDAYALIEHERFALVFVDIVLGPPGSADGYAVCRRVKQDGHRAPPVIVVSGLDSETERARAAVAGCDAYLTKPLAEAGLLQALRTLDRGFAARESSLTATPAH
jgi:CheY-like chemotaxis protein